MSDVLDITEQLQKMADLTTDVDVIVTGMKALGEIETIRAENDKLRAALAAIVHSVQVAQSMGCVSGGDFALTLPRAKVALSDSKSDN